MIKHKWIGIVAALLMSAAVLFVSFGYLMPSAFESVSGSADMPYVAAMDKEKVLNIQIVADEKDWQNMLDNATAEEYIAATVIINGTKIENVGIRPKGNSSLSQVASSSETDRYSFKIEFDHYVTGQAWLGLDKLAVNNMQGDATYMKEYLSYDIMNYAGVETPLFTFSNISVNGEEWGFYLAIEALEDSYAKRVYGNDHGKLYKPEGMGVRGNGQMEEFIAGMENGAAGESNLPNQNMPTGQFPAQGEQGQMPQDGQFPAQGQGQMPQNNEPNAEGFGRGGFDFGGGGFGGMSGGTTLQYIDDEISSYSVIFDNAVFKTSDSDYQRVISALEKLNAGEDLENVVDVEATLKYFAAHTVVVNLDSYVSSMCHNYYLYEKDGQLTMLPWDYNLAFGGFQSGNASSIVNFPIDTPVSGASLEDRPMLGKLLEVPEYLELYHSYLQEIVDGYFSSGLFEQSMDFLDALISPYVETDPSAFYDYSAYKTGVAELRKLGLLRAESIAGQLDGSIPSTTAGQSENPSALIDASSINTSALGSMGGGFGGIQGGNQGENNGMRPGGNMQGFNMENIQRAMEIIEAAGENELSEEQLAELEELGITEEQLAMFQGMGQGVFGGFAGGRGNVQGMGGAQQGDNQGFDNAPSSISSGYDKTTWIILGGCGALLLGGLLFVVLFKRRRANIVYIKTISE